MLQKLSISSIVVDGPNGRGQMHPISLAFDGNNFQLSGRAAAYASIRRCTQPITKEDRAT
eukprot:scaffold2018_cov113-Cylindrotheca_fusiformis.AAC.5